MRRPIQSVLSPWAAWFKSPRVVGVCLALVLVGGIAASLTISPSRGLTGHATSLIEPTSPTPSPGPTPLPVAPLRPPGTAHTTQLAIPSGSTPSAPAAAATKPGASPGSGFSAQGGRYHYTQMEDSQYQGHEFKGAKLQGGYTNVVHPRRGNTQLIDHYEGDSGQAQTDTLTWSATRLLLMRQDTEGLEGCQYRPPLIMLTLPLADGSEWSTSSDCVGPTRSQRITQSARVISHSRRDVPGYGSMIIWRIVVSGKIPLEGIEGRTHLTFTHDIQFAPQLLVPVKEVRTQRSFDGSSEVSYSRKTRTLLPPGSEPTPERDG